MELRNCCFISFSQILTLFSICSMQKTTNANGNQKNDGGYNDLINF